MTQDTGHWRQRNTGLKNTGANEMINKTQLETNKLIGTKREQEKANKDLEGKTGSRNT